MKSRKIPNFLDLNNVADGGASHLNWRKGLEKGYSELGDKSSVGGSCDIQMKKFSRQMAV